MIINIVTQKKKRTTFLSRSAPLSGHVITKDVFTQRI